VLLADLLDLVLPAGCGGCGAPGPLWCPRCADALGPPRTLPGPPRTVAAGRYRGPLRQALLGYKERGRRSLAGPLAGLLADAAEHAGLVTARCWLVPAPSRPGAARARGGDHMLTLVEHLAEHLAARPAERRARPAERFGVRPSEEPAAPARTVGFDAGLRMRPGGRDSVGLDATARAANLRGRIVARTEGLPPLGAGVILVDDVVTTGATLRESSAALAAAGVPVRGAVVLCDATAGRPPTEWSTHA
jgi:predicted amidophosphoribosyltransferase